MKKTIEELPLKDLIDQTREHLKSLNYAKDTMRHYENAWTALKNYAEKEGIVYFTTEFGISFLKEKYNINPFDIGLKSYPSAVRRSVTVLSDFQQHGIIFKRQPTKLHRWSDNYREVCETFLDNYVNNRLSSRTARQFRMQLERLTAYLEKNNINSIADVSPSIIEGYISTYTGYAKPTIAYALYILRCFFSFAYETNYTIIDFSVCIPSIKFNSKSTIPSVFTVDEIERLLKAVDRGSPLGKRDYAILLLAVRYGMRVSEITSLQLNNLDFESQKIRYIQNKTGNPIILDMFESLGWALIDYLKNARPKTNSTHVFVRHNSPFDAFGENNNLSSIMSKYISLANIHVPKGKKQGIHTLRHSLASHLLEQGTPSKTFTPYIFTNEQIATLISNADNMPEARGQSKINIIFPAVLRLLYCCGLRISEATALRIFDLDLNRGTITIRDSKNDNNRIVPISDSLKIYLIDYFNKIHLIYADDDFLFPTNFKEQYSPRCIYGYFRKILWQSGISHGGRGSGPRLHDLRHTFAVHSLQNWIIQGRDTYILLPILSAYLGHKNIYATEKYLRLTSEMYPNILKKVKDTCGEIIPEVINYEAN